MGVWFALRQAGDRGQMTGGQVTGGQVKKRQQAVVGFLEANRISFQEVDITNVEDRRLWMYQHIPPEKHPDKGNPLPPQIFNGDCYCGVR
ncbi:unnamed protein product [Coregonus sp. 'balchen']|nr:unnamed protein product [Coregonus sp. 'balchen']